MKEEDVEKRESPLIRRLEEDGHSDMLKVDIFISLLSSNDFNPNAKDCHRCVVLAISDVNCALDHIKAGSKSKLNLLRPKHSVSINQEWIKLLKLTLLKLKDITIAASQSRGDDSKA